MNALEHHPVFSAIAKTHGIMDETLADVESLIVDGFDKYDEAFVREAHKMLPRYADATRWLLHYVRLHRADGEEAVNDEILMILEGKR